MKTVVFLDIDGVLNSLSSVLALGAPSKCLDPVCIGLLARLCKETDAKIVVSSTWRLGRTVPQLQYTLDQLGAWELSNRFIGRTSDDHNGHRGRQIKQWIDENQFTGRYMIVDDDSDMLPEQMPFFVKTSFEDGFRAAHYKQAMVILKPEHADSKIITMAEYAP